MAPASNEPNSRRRGIGLPTGSDGPICAGALREGGVVPDVLPASPNSASLVNAVGDYFDLMTRTERSVEEP